MSFDKLVSTGKEGESRNKRIRLGYERRPAYHYTPKENWMSDPNGMVFFKGEFHLCYQYDDYHDVFSDMSWGHAISEDLIHWTEYPRAITPSDDDLGMIFSGGAVVDHLNSAGFGKDAIIATYTSPKPRQQQSIAYSLDRGRTWIKYEGNPVISNSEGDGIGGEFRDPKVVWNKYSKTWIMMIAVLDHIEFWTSDNLIDWTKNSEFGQEYGAHDHSLNGSWECPDILEMPVDDNWDETVWVLIVNLNRGGANGECGTQYFIGDFKEVEGKMTFESFHRNTKWLDYGPDNYAGVTWSNLERQFIFAGWMSNWQYALDIPTHPWRGVLSFPRELKLKKINRELKVTNQPIKALNHLLGESLADEDKVEIHKVVEVGDSLSSSYILFELDLNTATDAGIKISNGISQQMIMGYNKKDNMIYVDRRNSGETDFNDSFAHSLHTAEPTTPLETLKVEILLDKISMEVFVNDGEYTFTGLMFPTENFNRVKLFANAEVKMTSFDIKEIKRVMHFEER